MLNRHKNNEKVSATRSPPSNPSHFSSGGLLPALAVGHPSGLCVPGNSGNGGAMVSLKQFRQEYERPAQLGGARSLHWASAAPRQARQHQHAGGHGSKSPTRHRETVRTEQQTWTPVKGPNVARTPQATKMTPPQTTTAVRDALDSNAIPAILTALPSTRRLLQQHAASRIVTRPMPFVPVKTLSIQVGPESSLFVVPEPLLLSTSSHMLHHWLTSATTYQFTESANVWRLPTLDPHVFATIVDWLAKGPHNWRPHDPECVLELMAAAHYLDLPKLVDQCLDFVASTEWIYHISGFGGLAPCLIRAIVRRADPLGLVHAELVVAKDQQASPLTGAAPGAETKQWWIQHLVQHAGGSGPDAVRWPLDAHHVSTGAVRRMVLGLIPTNRRDAPFLGRERHMEAVELPASVSDEEARWVARLAKRAGRPIHLVLVNANWPPWTDHVGFQQLRPTSPTTSSVHRAVLLSPVGSSTLSMNPESWSPDMEDESTNTPKPILVHGTTTTWAIPPTSSAIPTSLWPLTRLVLDSCPSLTHSIDALCTWLTSSPTCPLTHLTISNTLSLDGMTRVLAAASARLHSLTLDRNPTPSAVPAPTPKSIHLFVKSLRATHLPHLRISNAHLPPATLASILDMWPPCSRVPVLDLPGMGLGPILVPQALVPTKPNLTQMNLANNRLVARTLVDLVRAASQSLRQLRALDVSWNQITAAVVDAVADALPLWPRLRRLGLRVRDEEGAAGAGAGGVMDSRVWARLFDSIPAGSESALILLVGGHACLATPNSGTAWEQLIAEDATAMRSAIEACVQRKSMCVVLGGYGANVGGGLGWWRKVVDKVEAHPVTVWSRAGIVSNALGGLLDVQKRLREKE